MRWLLLGLCLFSCRELALEGLASSEANEALIALEEAGISAGTEAERPGEYSLWVERGMRTQALSLLEERSLPKRAPRCQPEELFPSPEREAEARLACKAFEVARAIESLEGIQSAKVLLSPAKPVSFGQAPPVSSVAVWYRYSQEPKEEEIKSLVSAALGVSQPQISVIPEATKGPTEAEWAQVGPFLVAPSSKLPLTLTFLALFTMVTGSILACISLLLRQRRLNK